MELISWSLTPWILEISLLLPWPIFQFISIFTGYPTPEIISPGLADMMDGRRPMTLVYISKLLSVSLSDTLFLYIYIFCLLRLKVSLLFKI